MVRSVRLSAEQERRLQEAAQVKGMTISDFIREAVDRGCAEALKDTLHTRNKDLFGSVHLGGGAARRTGELFAALLESKARPTR